MAGFITMLPSLETFLETSSPLLSLGLVLLSLFLALATFAPNMHPSSAPFAIVLCELVILHQLAMFLNGDVTTACTETAVTTTAATAVTTASTPGSLRHQLSNESLTTASTPVTPCTDFSDEYDSEAEEGDADYWSRELDAIYLTYRCEFGGAPITRSGRYHREPRGRLAFMEKGGDYRKAKPVPFIEDGKKYSSAEYGAFFDCLLQISRPNMQVVPWAEGME